MKGVLFTLISLLLASLFIVIFGTQIRVPLDDRISLLEHEMDQMLSFSRDVEQYMHTTVGISGEQALQSLVNFYVDNNHVPTSHAELECTFASLAKNGTAQWPNLTSTSSDFNIQITVIGGIGDAVSPSTGTSYAEVEIGSEHAASPVSNQDAIQPFISFQTGVLERVSVWTQSTLAGLSLTVEIYPYPANGCLGNLGQPIYIGSTPIPVGMDIRTDFLPSQSIPIENGKAYLLIAHCENCQNGQKIQLQSDDMDATGDSEEGPYLPGNASLRRGHFIVRTPPSLDPMPQSSIDYFMSHVSSFSKDALGIVSDYAVRNVTVAQQYPFEVEVTVNVTFTLHDMYVDYAFDKGIVAIIPLEDISDPLFAYNHIYEKQIIKSPYLDDQDYNLERFTEFHNNGWYRYNSNGTSFLDRLLNVSKPSSCCGIESTVNVMAMKFDKIGGNGVFETNPEYGNISELHLYGDTHPMPPGHTAKANNPEGAPPAFDRMPRLNASYIDYLYFFTDLNGTHKDLGCHKSFFLNATAIASDPNPIISALASTWGDSKIIDGITVYMKDTSFDIAHLVELNIPSKYWITTCPSPP